MLIATKGMTIFIDVGQNIVRAVSADDLLGAPTGDALGGLVPKQNLPVGIGYISAVGQGIEEFS
jgi:hypothetical protein